MVAYTYGSYWDGAMKSPPPLPELRRALALYYALHGLVLERLDGPLPPMTRRLERAHLGRLEQLICDAEGRMGRIESWLLDASSA
jgi:hypothetical protein